MKKLTLSLSVLALVCLVAVAVAQESPYILFITGNKVGIGTTEPRSELDVNGNIAGTRLGIGVAEPLTPLAILGNGGQYPVGVTQNQVGSTATMELTTRDSSGNQASRMVLQGNSNTPDIQFYRGGRGSEALSMLIQGNSGNVGMGTSNPKGRLHVNGDYYGKGHVFLHAYEGDGSSGTAYLQARDYSGKSSIAMELRTQSNGSITEAVRISSDGKVGIGTTNPTAKLHVVGILKAQGLQYGDYRNAQYNDSTGEFFWDNSSRRYKENITDLDDDFSKILDVAPKTYTRPAAPERWELGYIAEDFDELGLAKLVDYDEEGRPDAINYEKMILYVVEILKRHEEELADVRSENQRLRQQLADVQSGGREPHERPARLTSSR